MAYPVGNLCVGEHKTDFSDTSAALLSESKHVDTQALRSGASVVLAATVWMIHLVICVCVCETLSCDRSRTTLGQTLLHAFLYCHDLNKLGSASCNNVVPSYQPDTISLKNGDLCVARNNKIYLCLHVKCPIFLCNLNPIFFLN
jgi:hypothetical protein